MTPRHLGLCLALCASGCSTSRPEHPPPPAPALGDLLVAARRGFVLDGELLINQQPQWRATVATSGELVFSAQPFEGHPAPAALSLRLVSARRGAALERSDVPGLETNEGGLALDWGSLTERLDTQAGHLEQSFHFAHEPEGSGPLEITLSATGFDSVSVDDEGAHFAHTAGSVGVRYGHGTWIDAQGTRTPVPVRVEGGLLRLIVPASVLADSHFPSVLDPTLDPEVTFPDGGTFVPAPRAQRAPAVGSSDAGWLVVWEDQRHALYRGTDLYASRVAFDGGILDPNGIPLVTASGDQLQPEVTFNGEQYLVSWIDRRAPGGDRAYAVFVAPSGQVGTEFKLTNNGGDQSAIRSASNGAMTFVTWKQVQLWGLRLLNDGGVLDPNGIILAPFDFAGAHSLAWNGEYFVHSHENNGPVAMFFGVDAGTRFFALSDGGTSNQINFTNSTNNALYGRTISLTALDQGRVGALWPRSNGGQWPSEIHSAVIDADGGWGEFKLLPYGTAGLDTASVRAAFDGTKMVGCVSGAFNQLPPSHVLAVSLNLDGGIGPVTILTTDAGDPNADCAVGSGPGVVLAAYRSRQEYEPSIRVQLLSGTISQPAPERVLSGTTSPQEHPAVARSGFTTRPWMIAWSDARTPYSGFDVYAQLLGNPGGSPAGTPFLLSARPADEVGVRLLGAGDGGYVATWSEGSPLDSSTLSPPRAMRISAAGLKGPVIDLPVSTGYPTYQSPSAALEGRTVVVTAGFNSYNLNNVFEGWSFGLEFDGGISRTSYTSPAERSQLRLVPRGGGVFAAWDNGDSLFGKFLFDGGGAQAAAFTLVTAAGAQQNVALAPASDGTLVAWEDWRSGGPRIQATYFTADGGGIGNNAGFMVSTQPGAQRFPAAHTLDDGRSIIVWEQSSDAGVDLFAIFLSPQGVSINPTGERWAGDGGRALNLRPVLTSDGVGRALLVWNRLDEDAVLTSHWRFVGIGAAQGGVCSAAADCSVGFCVDGRCCDSACGGTDLSDCQTCSIAAGGSVDGVCSVLPSTYACRPARHLTCDVPEFCEGSTDCPLPDLVQNTGVSCGAGGVCDALGACFGAGVDAGVDAGADAGSAADAGAVDAGRGDAGSSDAGGAQEEDGGGSPPQAPPTNISHYSWNQGCGCQTVDVVNGALLLGLLLLRGRRSRRAGAGALLALALMVVQPAAAQTEPAKNKRLKLTFPGVSAGAGAKSEDAAVLAEFLQTQLVALDIYEVTGATDLAALLGFDRQKQLLGCDATCAVDIAGALNADRLLNGSLSKLGDSWLLTLALFDVRTSVPIFRTSRRFTGPLDRALDAVDPMLAELIARDLPARTAAEALRPGPPPVEVPRKSQWTVGVRVEAEAMGLAANQPAIAPAISASWGSGMWGAALTIIVMTTPGVRAEGRLHLLESSRVRPLVSLGVSVFGLAVAPRASLGLTTDLGPVRLSLDGALEYFVSGPLRYEPLAVLIGAGVAWRF